ncbi:Uncharacterised protein [Bordetella pertussis]|nr:Uncharacterised protein [Bordetella pertussis]CPM25458.1 Uncharacterised protein [Bordetella pertussis]CPP78734.1 Uncharacterised protein [Bordetella pertussis]CRE03743.1 Uncharacterised protein [Bordetella pertussis]CRE17336.1 Uncharacterised protein [Bordetella pertussis]
MNGTPRAISSMRCWRPDTLSSSVISPPSSTMLFSEKRGGPDSGSGSGGDCAAMSATFFWMSEKLKRVTSSRTSATLGWRTTSESTTGANQNSDIQDALTSSSATCSSGAAPSGCASARSWARRVSVNGLKRILPTLTSRPSMAETSCVSAPRTMRGTCHAARPASSSTTSTVARRTFTVRRGSLTPGIRTGIGQLPTRIGGIIAPLSRLVYDRHAWPRGIPRGPGTFNI